MEESEVVIEENPDKSVDVEIALTDLSIAEAARDLTLEPIVTTTEEIKRPSTPEPGAPVVVVAEEAKTDDPKTTTDAVIQKPTRNEEAKDKLVPRGKLCAETGRECLWCHELQTSNFVGSSSTRRKETHRRRSQISTLKIFSSLNQTECLPKIPL